MVETINAENVASMIQATITLIRDNEQMLSKLDSATGDGDHGSAMVSAMNAADKALAEWDKASIQSLLKGVGWGMMCIDGGSTGPLWGSLFMGMSKGAGEAESLDCAAMADMSRHRTRGPRRDVDVASVQGIQRGPVGPAIR